MTNDRMTNAGYELSIRSVRRLRHSVNSSGVLQFVFVDRVEALHAERFDGDFDVVDHERHGRAAGGAKQQRVDLRDVHFGRQQRGADLQHRLRRIGQLDADQVGLDEREAGPLQNLAALLGIAEQESHQGTFGGIGDCERDDSHVAAFESADDVH